MNPPRALARHGWIALVALAALFVPAAARAAEVGRADIPRYAGYVTDDAGVLGEQRRAQLEAFLDQFARRTGVQFAVLTVKSTAPEEPAAYKERVFQEWGIGSHGEDNGLLLLLAVEQRRIVFETGYGLEGTLPDGWQASMLRELAIPRMRSGDVEGGVTAAVLAAAQRVAAEKGVTLEWNGAELRYDETARRRLPSWIVLLLLLVLFVVVSAAVRRRGYYSGPRSWHGGGWGGGFGGGLGGGFGGGFGGGGGSSFGGFGGGSSGGGGGGASW